MKKVWKSVNIWWCYGQEFGVLFDSQCRLLVQGLLLTYIRWIRRSVSVIFGTVLHNVSACHGDQFLLVSVHGCRWTQAASGAAGRANVGLCPASCWLKMRLVYGVSVEEFRNRTKNFYKPDDLCFVSVYALWTLWSTEEVIYGGLDSRLLTVITASVSVGALTTRLWHHATWTTRHRVPLSARQLHLSTSIHHSPTAAIRLRNGFRIFGRGNIQIIE